jgi:hypothetical protein
MLGHGEGRAREHGDYGLEVEARGDGGIRSGHGCGGDAEGNDERATRKLGAARGRVESSSALISRLTLEWTG